MPHLWVRASDIPVVEVKPLTESHTDKDRQVRGWALSMRVSVKLMSSTMIACRSGEHIKISECPVMDGFFTACLPPGPPELTI